MAQTVDCRTLFTPLTGVRPITASLKDQGPELASRMQMVATKILAQFPGSKIERFLDRARVDPHEVEKLEAQAKAIGWDPPTSFLRAISVEVPSKADEASALSFLRTDLSGALEFVYLDPPPPLEDGIQRISEVLQTKPGSKALEVQGYQRRAPEGICATSVWPLPGGKGEDVWITDVERGWFPGHEDLPRGIDFVGAGLNCIEWANHGTSVLGVLCSLWRNGKGAAGIAPAARVNLSSEWRSPTYFSTMGAILNALTARVRPDIVLVECQANLERADGSIDKKAPAEMFSWTRLAIQLGTILGVVMVEAAGNGDHDLDKLKDSDGKLILRRGHSDFHDSGAILVGAGQNVPDASSTNGARARMAAGRNCGRSSFGSRVDCYAWGDSILVPNAGFVPGTKSLTGNYRNDFGCTSAAAAIVAGAAALAIGRLRFLNGGRRPTVTEIRHALTASGTPCLNPMAENIGVMPNLAALALAPAGRKPRKGHHP